MAYRNKTYVCFDADNDIHYYRLMQAWKQNDNTEFDFYNAHELNRLLPTSSEDTIKRKLRERLLNTKTFIVLIGKQTQFLYRFVRWEMEQALSLNLPIVAVNLNGKRRMDSERCPAIIRNELAIHVSFNAKIIQYSLEHWEFWHYDYKKKGINEAYYFEDKIYSDLGIY